MQNKIAFVIPWYGEDLAGGAEALCRGYCHALHAAGADVEVWSTCCRDSLSDWTRNFHKPGEARENGITVRRFPLRKRDTAQFDRVNRKILNRYPLSPEEEAQFFDESIRSVELEREIARQHAARRMIFLPYCFGTTLHGIAAANGRGILLPCLHQEGYALLAPVRRMFQEAGKIIFNSAAECNFANRFFDLQGKPRLTLGIGIEPDTRGDAVAFRKKFRRERPFLLYLGRKDATKNVPLLLKYFQYYSERQAPGIDLLLAGPGRAEIAPAADARIIDLGELSAEDKFNALAAALALVQPSVNESLSIVLLEAWREGTPVIVNAHCDVTLQKCRQAGGGLSFGGFFEFCECAEYLRQHTGPAKQLGAQGRRHLREQHDWTALAQSLMNFANES